MSYLELFGQKSNLRFDLTTVQVQNVIPVQPPVGTNICTKFYDNSSDSCQTFLPKYNNYYLLVVIDEKSGDHQSV